MEQAGPELDKKISQPIEINKVKRPQDVIYFLRDFNFGNKNEGAQIAVNRFLDYIRTRHEVLERFNDGEVSFLNLFIDELEKAGFANSGTISREEWTLEAEQVLMAVLSDFEKLSDEEKAEANAKPWGP